MSFYLFNSFIASANFNNSSNHFIFDCLQVVSTCTTEMVLIFFNFQKSMICVSVLAQRSSDFSINNSIPICAWNPLQIWQNVLDQCSCSLSNLFRPCNAFVVITGYILLVSFRCRNRSLGVRLIWAKPESPYVWRLRWFTFSKVLLICMVKTAILLQFQHYHTDFHRAILILYYYCYH